MRELDAKIEKAIQFAIVNMRIEGFELSDEEIEMVRKRMYGEISTDEYLKWVLSNLKDGD